VSTSPLLAEAEASIEAYDYALPEGLIAQEPSAERDLSRLMVLPRQGPVEHRSFSSLRELLPPDAVLVLNDTRVVPARLEAKKETGGAIELLRIPDPSLDDPRQGRFMARGRLKRPGIKIHVGGWTLELIEKDVDGTVLLQSTTNQSITELLESHGSVPLPPYIQRPDGPSDLDSKRYQTVFAREPGAAAAPTAGLHFTEELLRDLSAAGIDIAKITLHVGPGTFMPVRVENIRDHTVLAEPAEISDETAAMLNSARKRRRPIIAVGTTVVRTLEGAAYRVGEEDDIQAGQYTEDTVIIPGHHFRMVQGLITNFHLPRSSLLLLVSAIAGRARLLEAYSEAIKADYRFYSYGDAMYLPPSY
jgi:S-adenosylmethionine:tRNA ribosyltransferase-isomerase